MSNLDVMIQGSIFTDPYKQFLEEEQEQILNLHNDIVSYEDRPYYLATPYSKFPLGKYEAYEMAAEMTMFLQTNGLFIYCPIVHSHRPSAYASKEIKENYDFWLTIDFKYIRLSKGLIVCKMDGWKESYGVQQEIKYCKEINKPIYYTNFLELPKELNNDHSNK